MWEHAVTGLITLVSGLLTGGGFVHFYKTWKAGRRTDQEFLNKQYQEAMTVDRDRYRAELQACHDFNEKQRLRYESMENSLSELKLKYTEARIENLQLKAKVAPGQWPETSTGS